MVIHNQPHVLSGIVAGRLIAKPRRFQAANWLTVADLLLPYMTLGFSRIRAGVLINLGSTLTWKWSCIEWLWLANELRVCLYLPKTHQQGVGLS